MIVKNIISSLWLAPASDAKERLSAILDSAPKGTEIFFRADDVGVPGDNCRRMIEIFRAHGVPLHLAVTPAWLTESRWATLQEWGGGDDFLCWHQHGWRHVNHQKTGKKGEFGTDRSRVAKKADLARGQEKLQSIMGASFQPFFTPPWNRFDSETAEVLSELGFKAVSRSDGEQKKVPLSDTLPDIFTNVDLHTRGEADPADGWNALMEDFEVAVRTGRVGVMLHHQRMNQAAFDFLDDCLSVIVRNNAVRLLRFDLL
ncbi:MAG: polysaccharide deacetylase family protein [Pseudodesulfovibrio sp.]|nr:polysaccharide deacetylase family protein [Pseudodesulfovibrio sp.]